MSHSQASDAGANTTASENPHLPPDYAAKLKASEVGGITIPDQPRLVPKPEQPELIEIKPNGRYLMCVPEGYPLEIVEQLSNTFADDFPDATLNVFFGVKFIKG